MGGVLGAGAAIQWRTRTSVEWVTVEPDGTRAGFETQEWAERYAARRLEMTGEQLQILRRTIVEELL